MANPVASVRRWSTQDVPAAIKFDYWAGALSHAVVPMQLSSPDRRAFRAEQEAIGLGPLDVIRSFGTAHESWRSRRDVTRSRDRSIHLLTSRGGEWRLRHCGEHRLQPGELVLVDNGREHLLSVDDTYDIINVKIPVGWLNTWLPDIDPLIGRPIRLDRAWGRALSAFAGQLLPDALVVPVLDPLLIAEHIGTLLAIAAGETDTVTRAERRLKDRIALQIRERCIEPELRPADVAGSLGLGERALHRALLAAGCSFAALLLEARIWLALKLLAAGARGADTTEIASKTGFRDASDLERALRATVRGPARGNGGL